MYLFGCRPEEVPDSGGLVRLRPPKAWPLLAWGLIELFNLKSIARVGTRGGFAWSGSGMNQTVYTSTSLSRQKSSIFQASLASGTQISQVQCPGHEPNNPSNHKTYSTTGITLLSFQNQLTVRFNYSCSGKKRACVHLVLLLKTACCATKMECHYATQVQLSVAMN